MPGMFADIVKELQAYLNRVDAAGLDLDGNFGGKTAAAALAYQKELNANTKPDPKPDEKPWRLATSLTTLRAQINHLYPERSKLADGSIGDAAHATRKSDHNPWIRDSSKQPVVTAIDITHDPDGGPNCFDLAEKLVLDPRTKYIIFNGQIYNKTVAPAWRKYTGKNAHKHHLHISVGEAQSLYDDNKEWKL